MEKRIDGRWWEKSWNPITGCTHAGTPGCDNCYARRMAPRLAGRFGYPEKPHQFDVTLHPDKLEEPLHWRKPRVVFVCSMGDLFHERLCLIQQLLVWDVMVEATQHVYLLLTKRPAEAVRLAGYLASRRGYEQWPAHIWPGVSVENQDAMWRIPELLKIPAAKHFVSFEPLLGPIDEDQLRAYLHGCPEAVGGGVHYVTHDMALDACAPEMEGMRIDEEPDWVQTMPPIDGVIVGGESGPGARPMHPDWPRSIRDQCTEAGTPFSFKQWGEWRPGFAGDEPQEVVGVYPWYEGWRTACELAVSEKHENRLVLGKVASMARVGKAQAGRLLDGQLWNQWPWDVIGGMGADAE